MALRRKIKSAREKARANRLLFEEAQVNLQKIDTNSFDEKIVALSVELAALDALISSRQKVYDTSSTKANKKLLNEVIALRAPIVEELVKAQKQSVDSKKTNESTSSNEATDGVEEIGTGVVASNQRTTALEYNASGVKELLFSERTAFSKRLMSSPNEPRQIRAANDLWKTAQASKGMIVTSEQVLKSWNTGSTKIPGGVKNYGFQFQYNPGTVGMSYFTSPNVDVTLMTSGQEMFNLAGTSGSQGAVSFQIIINRIFDMQYYTRKGFIDKKYNPRKLYSKPPAGPTEEQLIYNKGTMYDVEYFLRTLMGTTMKSYLRGEDTADMGWLPAIPVELHLGNKLRYLGTINTIQLNHIIFNERMVPLFTTVDVQFTRLPDYPSK